jgi:serine/threonine-protein kinase
VYRRTDVTHERLGEYEVLAPISEGGMGAVLLGRVATRPHELVALKVIRPEHVRNKEFVAMLADEARIASRLSHPNIPAIKGLGQSGKDQFLVMELLRGHTLLELWKTAHAKGKRVPHDVVAWIGARIADALHYAHELSDDAGAPLHVVHRDVNPANIFVTKEGVPKLIDFGLAKARDRIASTAIGVVKGKLAYLAPEQTRGQPADRRADVFALGVTLWEVSLDRRLFHEESDVQTVLRVRGAEVPDPATLEEGYPRALADVLVKALAKEPADRWQTAAELRDALDACARAERRVEAATLRALSTEVFADETPAEWERMADEIAAEQASTRIWDERKDAAAQAMASEAPTLLGMPAPAPGTAASGNAASFGAGGSVGGLPARLVAIAGASALVGGLVAGLLARGCRGSDAPDGMEGRVARIEDILGLADAGPAPAAIASAAVNADGAAIPSADDTPSAPCAVAKIAAYQAWQEALTKAKTLAAPAEANCAGMWSDQRKQACYHAAMAPVRAAQAARDSVIAGGVPARDAVKGVKDDPKNEAVARARASSESAFAACGESGGT